MSETQELFDPSGRRNRPGLDLPDARASEEREGLSRAEAARALTAEGCALEELDRSEEALAVFHRVIAEFGRAKEPEVREQVAFALLRTGLILCFVHRGAEAIAALRVLLKSFSADEGEAIADHLEVARERYQKLTYGSWR